MSYDFSTYEKRFNVGSAKWDSIESVFKEDYFDVIPTSVADMEFKVAPEIISAICQAATYGYIGYSNPQKEYYLAIKSFMEKKHSWKIEDSWITLTPGVIPALYTVVRAFTNIGEGVIIQPPVYYPFASSIVDSGRVLVENQLVENNGIYTIDFEDLENKLSNPQNTLMIISSPHNPVGRVWTREELYKIANLCTQYNVILVSDEIHQDLVYPEYQHTTIGILDEKFNNNIIVLTAPSKTFNIAGMQCANAIIPNQDLRNRFINSNNSIGIRRLNFLAFPACIAAYTKCDKWLDELIKVLSTNKQLVKSFINSEIPSLKITEAEGTYLIWIDCRSLNISDDELQSLFREKGRLYIDEGFLFGTGGSGFIRINIACPTEMVQDILNRIKIVVNTLIK